VILNCEIVKHKTKIIITDRVKSLKRHETLDFFNPPTGGYLRKMG